MGVWQYVTSIPSLQPALTDHRWYSGLAPKTRMFMGVGIMAWAGFGLLVTNEIEKRFDMTPDEKDYEEVRQLVPKISTVERGER
jgi:hypothetical protein